MNNQIEVLVREILDGTEPVGKAGLKLLSVCAMVSGLDWDKVSKFALKWESIKAGQSEMIPVPVVMIVMKDKTEQIILDEETEELLKDDESK